MQLPPGPLLVCFRLLNNRHTCTLHVTYEIITIIEVIIHHAVSVKCHVNACIRCGRVVTTLTITCRGYFIRVVAVQHLLCTFLRHCGGRGQVLSLGAGFDTTFFRLKAAGVLGDCVQYVEV